MGRFGVKGASRRGSTGRVASPPWEPPPPRARSAATPTREGKGRDGARGSQSIVGVPGLLRQAPGAAPRSIPAAKGQARSSCLPPSRQAGSDAAAGQETGKLLRAPRRSRFGSAAGRGPGKSPFPAGREGARLEGGGGPSSPLCLSAGEQLCLSSALLPSRLASSHPSRWRAAPSKTPACPPQRTRAAPRCSGRAREARRLSQPRRESVAGQRGSLSSRDPLAAGRHRLLSNNPLKFPREEPRAQPPRRSKQERVFLGICKVPTPLHAAFLQTRLRLRGL